MCYVVMGCHISPCPVVTGIIGDAKQSRELFLESAKLVKKKNNNVEKFCSRRVRQNNVLVQQFVSHLGTTYALYFHVYLVVLFVSAHVNCTCLYVSVCVCP